MAITVTHLCPLIQVFDMATSLQFYCDVLGFTLETPTQEGEAHFDWCLLRLGETYLMLNTAYEGDDRPTKPDAVRVRAHEDTGLYFGCPDPDAAYAHLRSKGVSAEPPKVAPYGMKQLYVRDPDGYVLCFQTQA